MRCLFVSLAILVVYGSCLMDIKDNLTTAIDAFLLSHSQYRLPLKHQIKSVPVVGDITITLEKYKISRFDIKGSPPDISLHDINGPIADWSLLKDDDNTLPLTVMASGIHGDISLEEFKVSSDLGSVEGIFRATFGDAKIVLKQVPGKWPNVHIILLEPELKFISSSRWKQFTINKIMPLFEPRLVRILAEFFEDILRESWSQVRGHVVELVRAGNTDGPELID